MGSSGLRSDVVFWEVDVQADFMLPGGRLYVPGAETIIPAIARLVELCRSVGALLISSADAHKPDDPELKQWPPHCMKGTPGAEIIPEARLPKLLTIPNAPGFRLPAQLADYEQIVIQKNELNVFSNPHSDELLRGLPQHGISAQAEVIVFGVVTEYCVQFAAEGLLTRGKRVAVITDAIKEIEAEKGECSLRDFQSQGARITTVAQVEQSLARESLRRA